MCNSLVALVRGSWTMLNSPIAMSRNNFLEPKIRFSYKVDVGDYYILYYSFTTNNIQCVGRKYS